MTFPPPTIPASPRAGDYPDAGAAVLNEQAQIALRTVEADGSRRLVAELTWQRRIKILTEAGLDAAKVRVPLGAYEVLRSVDARAVTPTREIVALDRDTVRVRPRFPRTRGADAVRVVSFDIPGATVGGIVDYRLRWILTDVDLLKPWVFADRHIPILRSELAVLTDRSIHIDFRQGHGSVLVDTPPIRRPSEDGGERLLFVRRDIPAYHPEPRMPHLSRAADWVAVVVVDADLGGETWKTRSWKDVADRLTARMRKVGGKPGTGTMEERYRDVRDALLPLPLDGLGWLKPAPAARLWRGEVADTLRAAAVLLERLRGGDGASYPAFVESMMGPPVVEGMPGAYPFVRVVAAVDVRDSVVRDPSCRRDPIERGLLCAVPPQGYAFVDPMCSSCRYGEMPTRHTGGRALVVTGDGVRWVDVPVDPVERNRIIANMKLHLDVDGTLQGAVSIDLAGAPARHSRQNLLELPAGPARQEALSRTLFGEGAGIRFERMRLLDLEDVEEPLRVRGRVHGALEEVAYERFLLRVADAVGPSFPGRWRTVRRYPAVLDAPSWTETVASLVLPPGYEVDVRPIVKFVEPFAEYAAGFHRTGRTLHFSRRLVLKRHTVPLEEWPAFREFVSRVQDFESEGFSVWLAHGGP